MKILINYATNSGSTYLASQKIAHALGENHQVDLQEIKHTSVDDILRADCCVWGSPSWDTGKKEGQPHQDFFDWMNINSEVNLSGKSFAVFGLGDKNYYYFCGAVNHLQDFLSQRQANLIIDALKINQFYFQPHMAEEQIVAWVDHLQATFEQT